jgi:chromosome segregation ATPase
MTRDLEKEKVLSTHKSEKTANIKEGYLKTLEKVDGEIKTLTDEIVELEGKKSLNPLVSQTESENSELQKKILTLEKEISLAQGKIKEAEFLMETHRKERANESLLKRGLQSKIEMIKMEFEEARKMNELIIEQKVKDKQEIELKAKEEEIRKVQDRIHNTKQRIDIEGREINRIVDEKVVWQQEIIEQEDKKESLDKGLAYLKKTVHGLKISRDMYEDKSKLQAVQFEPLQKSELKYKDTVVALELGIKTNKERLAQFEKQVRSTNADRICQACQGLELQ